MAITKQAMTDEQRKSIALEYLKAFDNKGVTSTGGSILDLFAEDAQVFFPKWRLAIWKQIGVTSWASCRHGSQPVGSRQVIDVFAQRRPQSFGLRPVITPNHDLIDPAGVLH